MKLVFLDFDGVVTNYNEEFGSYITHEPDLYGPSLSCVERLRQLCEETGARIIISSNWRKFAEDGLASFWTHPSNQRTVQNPLPKLKQCLGDLIIEALPKIRHMTKSAVLEMWFNENPQYRGLKYVILDDDLAEEF